MAVEIVKKCTAFITTMEKSAKTLFKDYETTDKVTILHKDSKDKKEGKKYEAVEVTFKISDADVTKSRTGAEQAKPISTNNSWTCRSAHMADKARHVVPYLNGKRVSNANKSFKPVISDYKKKWAAAMGADLVNCAGKKAYHSDQYHLELKDAKIGITQKEIDSCYSTYVDLTKDQDPKKNTEFEKNFKATLDKIRKKKGIPTEEEKKELERQRKRLEEIKKMVFAAKLVSLTQVFKKSGAAKKKIPVSGTMLPKDTKEFGTRTDQRVSHKKTIVCKTYSDVKIDLEVSYALVSFEHLKQVFAEKIELNFEIRIAGLLARAAAVSVDCKCGFELKKSAVQPLGKVNVSYFVDGLAFDDEKGALMLAFDGKKLK